MALIVAGFGCGSTARGGEAALEGAAPEPNGTPSALDEADGKEPTSPREGAPRVDRAAASPSRSAAKEPAASIKPTSIKPTSNEPTSNESSEGRAPSPSVSLGSPNYGSLEGAVALPRRAPGLRYNPRRKDSARYGTAEMIAALVRAAAVVHRQMPGGEVTINDLGYEAGGPIEHHGSHQSGRDVDVLFYYLDAEGEPTASVGAPVEPNGRAMDYRDLADPSDDVPLRIDLPRTWLFVQALIEDQEVALQRIFLVEHVRSLLLDHAERSGAPASAIERFAEMTCQPSYPHDDHFHFRFFCDPGDIPLGCRDTQPIYPWHRAALAERDLEPQLADGRRKKAKITTDAEARSAAGPLHEDVIALLDRRKAWSERPRPGRRYCR